MKLAPLLLLPLAACELQAAVGERDPQSQQPAGADAGPIQLDILFVIDNSGSMSDDQAALNGAVQHFVDQLATLPGGLPDLHVGVTSSNVGIQGELCPFQTTGCVGNGDDGRLLAVPRGACTPPDGLWISDAPGPEGTRITNHEGTLVETFACIAALGSTGCGLEQHFEAMRRALDGRHAEQAGFLRPNAFLAVIFVADEDDCSAADCAVFDPASADLSDPLGPFGSFRCTEFGVVCGAHTIARAPGEYQACVPREDSYLRHPGDYASFLRAIKPDNRLFVAALVGDPDPFYVVMDDDGNPKLGASCSGPTAAGATPGVRFDWLLDQFPGHSDLESICSDDFAVPLTAVGVTARAAILDGLGGSGELPGGASSGCSASGRGRGGEGAAALLLAAAVSAWVRRRTRSWTPGGRGRRCTRRAAGRAGAAAGRCR